MPFFLLRLLGRKGWNNSRALHMLRGIVLSCIVDGCIEIIRKTSTGEVESFNKPRDFLTFQNDINAKKAFERTRDIFPKPENYLKRYEPMMQKIHLTTEFKVLGGDLLFSRIFTFLFSRALGLGKHSFLSHTLYVYESKISPSYSIFDGEFRGS